MQSTKSSDAIVELSPGAEIGRKGYADADDLDLSVDKGIEMNQETGGAMGSCLREEGRWLQRRKKRNHRQLRLIPTSQLRRSSSARPENRPVESYQLALALASCKQPRLHFFPKNDIEKIPLVGRSASSSQNYRDREENAAVTGPLGCPLARPDRMLTSIDSELVLPQVWISRECSVILSTRAFAAP